MVDIALDGVRQQMAEQVAFFKSKLNLPSETWRDIERAAHDRAFMVAGAAKADLLSDLRSAVHKAVEGGSLGEFRKDFAQAVAKSGWTGEGTPAGEAWRTRVIYQTNVAASYAAGRRAQLLEPALLERRKYWRYVHNDGVTHPRPEHKMWGDMRLTLPHDHPFWDTHFPPNGWGCGCRVVAVAAPGPDDATEPPQGWDSVDPRTGAPVGIDAGWGYAPGANVGADLRQFVQDKLINYPPAIARALTVDVSRYINATDSVADFVQGVRLDKRRSDPLWLGFVDPDQAEKVSKLVGVDVRGYPLLLPPDAVLHIDDSHGFDGRGQRPAQATDFALVAQVLNAGTVSPSETVGKDGHPRFSTKKAVDGEVFKAAFEVRPGKRNRSLSLVTLSIKTRK